MKHTPGPWVFGFEEPYGWDIRGEGIWIASVHNNHSQPDCRPTTGFPSQAEGFANSRLVAAAPDLLEACKEVINMLYGEYPEHPMTIKMAAAIAKAEEK